MIVKTVIVERNFHIMNEDRFVMEKDSLVIDIEEGEDEFVVLSKARQMLEQSFIAYYPDVNTSANFNTPPKSGFSYSNEPVQQKPSPPSFVDREYEAVLPAIQKKMPTNEKPLCDWINACKTVEELETFEVMATTQGEVKLFNQRKEELKQKESV